MESVGKYLRMERESRKLSLRQVSEATRIHERLLAAIEEDRFEVIASPLYVKGFLEAYSKYLHLDPNEIVLQYRKEHGGNLAVKKTDSAGPAARRKKRTGLWLFITSALVVLALLLIYLVSHSMPF